MRIRRSVPILLVVVLVAAALTLIVQLRKHAPPEAARLLPGADGFLYVNLQWMRRANVTGDLPKVPHDPEYEDFIQATGFQFERDLDEAAFAIHYPSGAARGKSANPDQPRFSEILVGKIEGEKLSAYLRKLATSVDNYRSIDIYNIPLEGRTLRVAILAMDTVVASNHNDPQVIRGIIERSRKLASPFGGPAFLRQYYKEVPFASLGWAIFRAQPSNTPSGSLDASMLFSKPAVVVASVRYLGSVHFKAEAITNSEEEAKQVSDRLSSFLTIFRAAEITVAAPGPDASLKQFFESLKVAQHGERAELSAILPPELIRKMVAESPEHFTPQPPAPVPSDVHK